MKSTKHFSILLLTVFFIDLHNTDGARPTWNFDNIARHEVGGLWIRCHDVIIPIGHQFVPCSVPGGKDSFQQCPKGTYQPDRASSKYEPVCTSKVEKCASVEDEIEVFQNCSLANHPCFDDGRCSIRKGKCGPNCFDCNDIPGDCPLERVNQDCSCSPPTTLIPSESSTNSTPTTTHMQLNTGNSTSYTDEQTVVLNRTDIISTKRTSINGSVEEQDHEHQQRVQAILITLSCLLLVAVITLTVYLKYKLKQRKSDNNENVHVGNDVQTVRAERPTAEVHPLMPSGRRPNACITNDAVLAEQNPTINNYNQLSNDNHGPVYRTLSLSSLQESYNYELEED